jgi:hypothetical protein
LLLLLHLLPLLYLRPLLLLAVRVPLALLEAILPALLPVSGPPAWIVLVAPAQTLFALRLRQNPSGPVGPACRSIPRPGGRR